MSYWQIAAPPAASYNQLTLVEILRQVLGR